VVDAVLSAAGHRARARRHLLPAGLSEREVEVLRLLARGLSNR
jgi:DNA-binding CsgD family transcriptional regulator